MARFKEGMHFAFAELIDDDIGAWFLARMLVARLISTFLKPEIIEAIGKGISEMLVMHPIHPALCLRHCLDTNCAALIAKGVSPGAALVFLLAGPTTNGAAVIVTSRILGKRNTVIYVLTIAACSLGLGYATNLFYSSYGSSHLISLAQKSENQAYGLVHYASFILNIATN